MTLIKYGYCFGCIALYCVVPQSSCFYLLFLLFSRLRHGTVCDSKRVFHAPLAFRHIIPLLHILEFVSFALRLHEECIFAILHQHITRSINVVILFLHEHLTSTSHNKHKQNLGFKNILSRHVETEECLSRQTRCKLSCNSMRVLELIIRLQSHAALTYLLPLHISLLMTTP